MYLAGPANISISDNTLEVFGSTSEPFSPILFTSSAGCNPSDSLTQIFRVERTKLTLPQLTDNSRYIKIKGDISATYSRSIEVYLSDIIVAQSISELPLNPTPVLEFYMHTKTYMSVSNFALSGMAFQTSIIVVSTVQSLELNTLAFSNINQFGLSLINIANGGKISVNKLTINGCTADDLTTSTAYLSMTGVTELSITGFTITNTSLQTMMAIRVTASTSPSFTMTNTSISNTALSEDNSIIKVGVLSQLKIDTFTVTNVSAILDPIKQLFGVSFYSSILSSKKLNLFL